MATANWISQFRTADGLLAFAPWLVIIGLFTALVLISFVVEMNAFTTPGRSFERIGVAICIIAYLGLLPCFLTQLRWVLLPTPFLPHLPTYTLGVSPRELERMEGVYYEPIHACSTALALAIFVPKCCDIGAYCTGRLIGRHKMTPVLSPKKTWEGAIGGLVAASLVSIGINRLAPVAVFPTSHPGIEIAFGLVVGGAGMLGDLAESLIKRDCEQKDASQAVPGFGGVLDVVDSVIFSAPVSYFFILVFSTVHLGS